LALMSAGHWSIARPATRFLSSTGRLWSMFNTSRTQHEQ
jgi:hypothetical protein